MKSEAQAARRRMQPTREFQKGGLHYTDGRMTLSSSQKKTNRDAPSIHASGDAKIVKI